MNRSTVTQNGITPSGPTVVGGAAFTQTAAFAPASLSLAPGATGAFTGKMQATGEGLAVLQASARNTAVSTTAPTSSLQVNVSSFPALLEALPSSIAPGDTVTVRLVVSNPSTSPYRDVVPRAPNFTGTAVPSLLSGPTPASATSLGPGSSVSLIWKYQMNGPIGSTFQFDSQADATRDGSAINTE